MNTFQFDSKIAANKLAISGYQLEIKELEEKIKSLRKYIDKLNSDAEHLNRFAGKTRTLIQSLSDHHGSAAKVNQSFFSDLSEATNGSGLSKAKKSLDTSHTKAQKKVEELKRRIEEVKLKIQQCNHSIESLKNQKTAYIAKEKAKEAEKQKKKG